MSTMKDLDKSTIDILVKSGVLKIEDLEKLTSKKRVPSEKVNIRESVSEFFEYMRKEYSDNTAVGYKMNVENFIIFLLGVEKFTSIKKDTALPETSSDDIDKWFTCLMANGYTPASIKRFKHSLKKFFDFVAERGYNPPRFEMVEMPQQETTEIEALRDDEIRSMAEHATSLRDKVIILTMYEAGMRRQELIDCKKEYIDLANKTVKIYNNGKFDRVGYFSDEVIQLIQQYIEEWEMEVDEINDKRKKRSEEKHEVYRELKVSDYLFQTPRSEQVSYSTIYKALKDTAFEYFLNRNFKEGMTEEESKEAAEERSSIINTDTLRHSRRAYLFSVGKTLEQVQAIMGDENRWICKRYLSIAQKLYSEKFRG